MELRDVTELIVDSEHKTAPKEDTGYPYVRTPNIGEGRLILDDVQRISEESYKKWTRRAVPQKNDLILAREAPVGNVAIVTDGITPCLGQRTVLIRPDPEKIEPEYLVYLMLGDEIQERFYAVSTGATVPHLNMSDIRGLELPELPSQETQRRIASILSAFDDLIENNSRRIEILEEMARRIYREWFVQFRYPGHEEDDDPSTSSGQRLVDSGTELGEIPEGWDIVEVQDVIDVNPRTSIDKVKERPYLPMANVSENSMLIDDTDIEYRDGSGGSKFKNYDTLFARITPSLENGKTGFVQFLKSDEQIALGSTEFIVLRSKKLNPYFVYCLARDGQFRESAIKSMVGASGRQRVRIGTVKEFKITFPPKDLLKKFSDATEPMFMEVGVLSEQNKKLKATRDLLLPKLISGKIDVGELNMN